LSASFDTNVVIYAFTAGEKQAAARHAMANGGVISVQVLNEFVNVMRKKRRAVWPEIEDALRVIQTRFSSAAPITAATHAAALALARDHGFAFYDALIVAAAIEAGCDTLYSEDMQHGGSIGGMTIVNPFIESAA
jgi:predicted nucleic acid-binding protein